MSEKDSKLLGLVIANRDKYIITVDNDNISIYEKDTEDIEGSFVGDFDSFGDEFICEMFNYLGCNVERA